jgi:hypothetical protein
MVFQKGNKYGCIHRGYKQTEEHKRKISKANKGQTMSEENRLILSMTRKGKDNPNWKENSTAKNTGAHRCERMFPIEGKVCEICKSPKVERHHKDGNKFNNTVENIQFLCRRHHMTVDKRLEKLIALDRSRGD